MIERVLVPMDDSEMAERALRYALEAHPTADIIVLHVVGAPSPLMGGSTSIALADDPNAFAKELAEDVFDRARSVAQSYDVEIRTELKIGHPVRGILQFVEEEDIDTVIMGSHSGTIADRLFIGNVSEKVFRRSPVPVTTVR